MIFTAPEQLRQRGWYQFFDRLRVDAKDTYRRFGFSRPAAEERAANQKGSELLMRSPYKDQLTTAQCFFQALHSHSREIPNLVSPHLGNSILTNWTIAKGAPCAQPSTGETAKVPTAASVVALPLGARIKVDPFDDQLHLLKFKAASPGAEYEKMPFEITPTILYLTRQYSSLTQKGA